MADPGTETMHEMVEGAAAGVAATVVMSAVMLGAGRLGLVGRQAPAQITERALERATGSQPAEEVVQPVAVALHLGFGAAAGAAFALLHRRLPVSVPPLVSGPLFASAVWALSYRGWAPALKLMPDADRDRPGRPQTMIVAHLVYGSVLGLLLGRSRRSDARRAGRAARRPGA